MHLVISLLVLRAGCGIWLYQFLIIAYLFTLKMHVCVCVCVCVCVSQSTLRHSISESVELLPNLRAKTNSNPALSRPISEASGTLPISLRHSECRKSCVIIKKYSSSLQLTVWQMRMRTNSSHPRDDTPRYLKNIKQTYYLCNLEICWSLPSLLFSCFFLNLQTHTVNFLNIRTPKILVVIPLKVELCGPTIV